MASTISGSIEAENSRQGVEITTSAQVFASVLPRLLSNSSPRIVVEGRPLGESTYFDESITTEINTKKVELAPQHIAETRDFGYPKTHYNETPFEEVETLNPVRYVKDESWETRYPVVLDAASFTDPGTLDGAIEPFTIRAVASRQATEGSATARGVKGKIEGYADDALGLSNPIEQRQYYEGYQGSTRPYLEYGDTLERPIKVKVDYFQDEPRNSSPHLDTDDTGLVASYVADDQLAAIVGAASGSFQKFGYSFRSSGAGWTVKDTENGTDSVTFLDRLSSSGSLAPRSNVTRVVRQVTTVNVGFRDSDAVSKVTPFNANRVIENAQQYYPGNSSLSPLVSGGKTQDISVTAQPGVIQRNLQTISDDITSPGFFDTLTKSDLLLPDGTYGKSVIRINISTVSSSAELGTNVTGSNLGYAGRIDSRMAKTAIRSLFDVATFNGSLFLSSAFRNTPESSNLAFKATGIAGTGFLYYSPTRRAWIEKRHDHSTSLKVNDYSNDRDGGHNSIEVNTWPHGTGTNPFLFESPAERIGHAALPNSVNAPSNAKDATRIARSIDNIDTSSWYSTVMQVSGTNETLSQFTASPQIGYFLPYREHQETLGYKNIGSPTTVFGAPFAPKYHAFDDETIKMSDYIDRPFLLRKVIIKVPVEVHRRHDYVSSSYTVNLGGNSAPLWTKDVTARKDIDNYTFFLYRQRRTKPTDAPLDSEQDISSSVRFLIASASVCVYNGPTFGRAYSNGFYNFFGNSTPVYNARIGSARSAEFLDALTSYMFATDTDPITAETLTRNSGTLHTPSLAIDTNIPLQNGVRSVRYFGRGGIKLNAYPSVVAGGWSNSSLTYVTSSTAHYSTSFYVNKPSLADNYTDSGDTNRLFNRYPYTGSFQDITDRSHHPPITTVNQHFWFGSTRQPVFNTNASPFTNYSGSALTTGIGPYATFYRDDPYFATEESLEFRQNYRDPTFDIEIGRVGFSIFNNTSEKPFESTVGILYDGRSNPNFLGRNARPELAGTIQRSSLIEFEDRDSESYTAYNANFTIGSLSGSNMAELIASLTVGYAPAGEVQHTLRNYLLMPEDELVLGLDAGVTPPPDIAPLQGKPMPDADPSINTVFNDTSAGATQIAAMINAARRRQRRRQQARRERRREIVIQRAVDALGSDAIATGNALATSGYGVFSYDSGVEQTGTTSEVTFANDPMIYNSANPIDITSDDDGGGGKNMTRGKEIKVPLEDQESLDGTTFTRSATVLP